MMHAKLVGGSCAVAVFCSALLYAQAADSRLLDAVKRGDRGAVRSLLAQKKADVNVAEADGTTPLHWAAERDTKPRLTADLSVS